MKTPSKVLIAATSAALLGGCASGGGGGGGNGDGVVIDTAEEQILCMIVPFLCFFSADVASPGSTSASASAAAPNAARGFTSWSELGLLEKAEFDALSSTLKYTESAPGEVGSTSAATPPQAQVVVRSRDAAARTTVAGMDLVLTSVAGGPSAELRADPYAQGWNYQSFGVWDRPVTGSGTIGATSFGAVTPASAVPSSGAAAFTGRLGGLYVSPTGQGSVASAQLNVNADFSSRSLSFASSGTTVTRDHGIGTAAPQLNLSGTLTYSPSTNTFSGALTSAGGTMRGSSTGRYYGPAAQELGGVFTVKSATTVETLAGAYGAKR